MRNPRSRKAVAIALLLGGFVLGLSGPAVARTVAHTINGSQIAKHSISGNRLKSNTVTGAQVKESTLGTVPKATRAQSLPHLVWVSLKLKNSWANYTGVNHGTPAYAVDAEGSIHLKGAISGGLSATTAFTLPAALHPSRSIDVVADESQAAAGRLLIAPNGDVQPVDGDGEPGSASSFTSLDGIIFSIS
jgi:hypothetical protein